MNIYGYNPMGDLHRPRTPADRAMSRPREDKGNSGDTPAKTSMRLNAPRDVPSRANIRTGWRETQETLYKALLDISAPIERAKALGLLSAVFVNPGQKLRDDRLAQRRALGDAAVVVALKGAGVPLLRKVKPDTSVWVGAISGIVQEHQSARVQKTVFPSDRFAEQHKMFASFAAYQRYGAPKEARFDVWMDQVGQVLSPDRFKGGFARLSEALENLRRQIASHSEGSAEVVFVGLDVMPMREGRDLTLRSHLIVQRQGPFEREKIEEAIVQKLGRSLTLIQSPTLAQIETALFGSEDMLALSACGPARIVEVASLIERCKLQRPCGAFRAWRSSEIGASTVPMLARSDHGLVALLVRKSVEKAEAAEDLEEEVIEDENDEEQEVEEVSDDIPQDAEQPESKSKLNIKKGVGVGILHGSFFYEPIVRIQNYDPMSKEGDDLKRLSQCFPREQTAEFERRLGLSSKQAKDLNLYLSAAATELAELGSSDAMWLAQAIVRAMLEPEATGKLRSELDARPGALRFWDILFERGTGGQPQLRKAEAFLDDTRDLWAGKSCDLLVL